MKTILTGDRPTGQLHIGHYFGTLLNRVRLQDDYKTIILIADLQVLTDHLGDFGSIEQTTFNQMLDYLAVGLKPTNTFVIQSQVPELAELTSYFTYLVTVARLQRNPTLKSEASLYGTSQMSLGFLSYPVSQAADILGFKADLIPVGQDQMPHIEQTREVVRSFNRTFGRDVFREPEALVGECPVLVGTDGQNKMGKSLGNSIAFAHSPEETTRRIMRTVTDRSRIHPTDPGHPGECTAYKYWCLLNPAEARSVGEECRNATRGCKGCKEALAVTMNAFLAPIRERRDEYATNPREVWEIVGAGTAEARSIASQTLSEVREAMKLNFPQIQRS